MNDRGVVGVVSGREDKEVNGMAGRKRRACVEATTSRGLGFHRPYYHLARIYFAQAESKNGAPRYGFDLIR